MNEQTNHTNYVCSKPFRLYCSIFSEKARPQQLFLFFLRFANLLHCLIRSEMTLDVVVVGWSYDLGKRRMLLSDFTLNWAQTTNAAFTPPRTGFNCLQNQNFSLVMGAQALIQGQANFLNDVWISLDGSTWTVLQPAAWSPQSR